MRPRHILLWTFISACAFSAGVASSHFALVTLASAAPSAGAGHIESAIAALFGIVLMVRKRRTMKIDPPTRPPSNMTLLRIDEEPEPAPESA